jgi:UDP-N-acetylglucosamine 2-epimerase (non-hydrolysing)
MIKVITVVGVRPNFMKVAPILKEMDRRKNEFTPVLVHTGQHYDEKMSDAFFRDLDMPKPDIHLGAGSGSHAQQTASVMIKFEPVVLSEKPDWVVVVGDVNSTLACALVCAKLHVKVAHVEAGLRSRDRTMPEEINRLVTDQISDLLLTPSNEATTNLLTEGLPAERIRFVGNVMIDSLNAQLKQAASSTIRADLNLDGKDYAVLTLHRPSNVDSRQTLERIIAALGYISEWLPIIFPVHPRTRKAIMDFGLDAMLDKFTNIKLIEPLGYIDFLQLYSGSRLVMTDSGGIQDETTALSIPCLTLRENTERPITVEMGTNLVVGTDPERIINAAKEALSVPKDVFKVRKPPLWDGRTAERIVQAIWEINNP